MKKNIIRSRITAVILEVIGVIINHITHHFSGEFFLTQVLFGGEWQVWRGVGMGLNKVCCI